MVETKRILVMSDTHGLKQDDITKIIAKENCDYNIHCGDYLYDFDYMKEHFDYFVDGNNDVKHGSEYNSKTFTIQKHLPFVVLNSFCFMVINFFDIHTTFE